MSGYTLGIDIGGTKTAAAIIGPGTAPTKPDVIGYTEVPTPARDGAEAVIAAAADVARTAIAASPYPPDRCGIGTAGTVDPAGVVTHATDALPGWLGIDLTARFTAALGIPVTVLNDVHAMGLGEARHGAAAGDRLTLIVSIGTGIGGALVHEGRVITGASGSAGVLGHLTVAAPWRRRCGCGRWNHLEAYASGPAIETRYAELAGSPARLPEIGARARAGDQVASTVITTAADLLGSALVQVVTVVDPDSVVLTGGVARLGDLLGTPVATIISTQALPGPDRTRLRYSTLGAHATLLGAADAARTARA